MRSSIYLTMGKAFPTEMWAFALPLWAYILVGFCPMGFCSDTISADTNKDDLEIQYLNT